MEITAAALWLNTAFAAFDQSITLLVHQLYGLAGGGDSADPAFGGAFHRRVYEETGGRQKCVRKG